MNLHLQMLAHAINDKQRPLTKNQIVESCTYLMSRNMIWQQVNLLIEVGALLDSGESEAGKESRPGLRARYEKYQLSLNWQHILDEYYLLPKVYLAGKMNGSDYESQSKENSQDWRWPIIGAGLFNTKLDIYSNDDDWQPAVTSTCNYVGPFYKYGKSHDGYQENDRHGVGAGDFPLWAMHGLTQTKTVQNCIESITEADIFFAWLNTTDAHGTLMEIAMACQHEYKQIVLVVPPCKCLGTVNVFCTSINGEHTCQSPETHTCVQYQVWFAQTLVKNSGGQVIYSDDPIEEYHKVIARWKRRGRKFNSVPEKEFWTRVITDQSKGLLYNDIVPQHPVGKYRIDFAIPELKFGIEIDGLAYHNGQDSFMKDRSRQREIESQGWRIVRFAAKEISLDVDKCFREANAIALELSQALVGAE